MGKFCGSAESREQLPEEAEYGKRDREQEVSVLPPFAVHSSRSHKVQLIFFPQVGEISVPYMDLQQSAPS